MNAYSPLIHRVVIDPEILGGMPVVLGTRVPAETILAYLNDGYSVEEILQDYPSLSPFSVDAVRAWATTPEAGMSVQT